MGLHKQQISNRFAGVHIVSTNSVLRVSLTLTSVVQRVPCTAGAASACVARARSHGVSAFTSSAHHCAGVGAAAVYV